MRAFAAVFCVLASAAFAGRPRSPAPQTRFGEECWGLERSPARGGARGKSAPVREPARRPCPTAWATARPAASAPRAPSSTAPGPASRRTAVQTCRPSLASVEWRRVEAPCARRWCAMRGSSAARRPSNASRRPATSGSATVGFSLPRQWRGGVNVSPLVRMPGWQVQWG